MKERKMKRLVADLLCFIFIGSFSIATVPVMGAEVSASIKVDADLSDWENIPAQISNDSYVREWKVAKDAKGNVYLCFAGEAVSEWDGNYIWKGVGISQNDTNFFGNFSDSEWSLAGQTGATVVTKNLAHGNSPADYMVEACIPAEYFKTDDYTISFCNNDIKAGDIPVIDGTVPKKEDAVYQGITIDGVYSDWDAVARNDASCPNEEHKACIRSTAAVFDGDYLYLYLEDGPDGDASGAGSHGNGQYAITTDLGKELLFQLRMKDGGTVNGIKGATARHVGAQWEIAIPRSQLPEYTNSLNFGLYMQEPFIKGIVNVLEQGGNVGSFEGIVYDGLYGDWKAYPHTLIQYATAGTQESVVDAEGALYSDGDRIYGHVITLMPEHLKEGGKEFAEAVTIQFNEDWNTTFYPRLVAVDENGNIDWNPKTEGLQEGTYEFYLASTDAWHTSTNLDNLNPADRMYGKIMITISAASNECEFYLDLPALAEKFGCDASDFKTIRAQFGRIGQQWITTAGASSGPWIGLLLCGLCVVGASILRKYKSGV